MTVTTISNNRQTCDLVGENENDASVHVFI